MQFAFIKLTSAQDDTPELWVSASQISHIGVCNEVTFVETRAGCSYVKETPAEVMEMVGTVAEYFD